MATVLAIIDRMETQVQLSLYDLIDGLIFNAVKLGVFSDDLGFHAVQGDAFIN